MNLDIAKTDVFAHPRKCEEHHPSCVRGTTQPKPPYLARRIGGERNAHVDLRTLHR